MASSRAAILIGLMAVVCIAGNSSKVSVASNEELKFQKWVDAWVEIWNTYDLNQVEKLFLLDDRTTYFSSEKEGVIIGFDAVREHHRGFGFVEGGKEQPNKLWVEDLYSSTFGKTVVVTGIWFFQRPDRSVQRGPVTFVYVKQGKEFRIAHMHFAIYLENNKKEDLSL